MMIALVGSRSGARGWSLFAAALAATLVAGPQASEAAERCGHRNGAPEVTLTSLRGELAYYGSQTEADLRRLYLKAGGSGRWHGWNPAGLTLADLEIGLRVEVRAQPLSRGRFCAELAGWTRHWVIARSMSTWPAATAAVPASTNRSWIMRTATSPYSETCSRNTGRGSAAPSIARVMDQTPQLATSPGIGAERFKDRLRNQVAPLIREMNRTLNRADGVLDTAENYRAEQRLCTNW